MFHNMWTHTKSRSHHHLSVTKFFLSNLYLMYPLYLQSNKHYFSRVLYHKFICSPTVFCRKWREGKWLCDEELRPIKVIHDWYHQCYFLLFSLISQTQLMVQIQHFTITGAKIPPLQLNVLGHVKDLRYIKIYNYILNLYIILQYMY